MNETVDCLFDVIRAAWLTLLLEECPSAGNQLGTPSAFCQVIDCFASDSARDALSCFRRTVRKNVRRYQLASFTSGQQLTHPLGIVGTYKSCFQASQESVPWRLISLILCWFNKKRFLALLKFKHHHVLLQPECSKLAFLSCTLWERMALIKLQGVVAFIFSVFLSLVREVLLQMT